MGGWPFSNRDIGKNMGLKKWIVMPGIVSDYTSKSLKFGFRICENSDTGPRRNLPVYPL